MRIDDVTKRPAARKVFFMENPAMAARMERAELARWRAEKAGDRDAANDAAVELEDLRVEGREVAIGFYLTSIGREAYEQLLAEHPPSQSQRNKYAKEIKALPDGQRPGPLRWNSDTFPPALLSACVALPEADELDEDDPPLDRWVEPMTVDEATALWSSERWSTGELTTLLSSAMAVNAGGSVVELKGS